MPIIDYVENARRIQNRVFSNSKISARNKKLLKDFLVAYDVSPARLGIFLTRIAHLLEADGDVSAFIHRREEINQAFFDLRRRYSAATFSTIVKVAKRFARWLNEGEIPKGMRDIKSPAKAKMLRSLNPHDMVSWEEGIVMARASSSLQVKAVILTQLDGGFRPSEFVDQNYGDVSVEGRLVIINVSGKTGKRVVVLHRCAPYFLRWYEAHPTKKVGDPLWIVESNRGGKNARKATDSSDVRRYAYSALVKRIAELGQRAGLTKPLDFYNLRHSSCVLDKLDNLPIDLAAQRHGHSVEHFVQVYGRLSVQDLANRFSKHYGLSGSVKEVARNIQCGICGHENTQNTERCFQCGTPMSKGNHLNERKEANVNAAQGIIELTLQLDRESARRKELEQALAQQRQMMEASLNQMKEQLMDAAIREINLKLQKAANPT